jgi:hypothetical protein
MLSTGLLIGVVLSLVPLVTFGGPDSGLMGQTIRDLGHLPLFGWITTLLLLALHRLCGSRLGLHAQYIAALVIALGLGLATELIQMVGPRDADAWDLFRNVLGAVCAIVWWPTFDRRFKDSPVRAGRNPFLLRLAVVAAFLVTALPLIGVTQAYVERWPRMPVLFDFSSENQARFMKARHVWWKFSPPLPAWTGNAPEHAARVSFSHFAGSALVFMEPTPDWTGHETFYFEVFHPREGTLEFGVRIDDQHYSRRWSDRFGRNVFLEPGFNRIEIPLDDVLHGPVDRLLDLERIQRIVLYPVDPVGGYELYFGSVGLVRSSSTSPG